MINHRPWIGAEYQSQRQKILIVGFSHWGEPDHDGFTEGVVSHWAAGDENVPFCNRIRSYFGDETPANFWQRVAFANTLPSSVGPEGSRYSSGSPEQREAAPARVVRLVEELTPNRVLVFSKAAWRLWPDYTGAVQDGTIRLPGMGDFDCGTYRHADGEAFAFGFKHPQYARTDDMKAAVSAALAFDPAEARVGELE